MPDLLIRGGTLVTPSGLQSADIAIDGETISAIAPHLPSAAREIDATGLTIFPGLIDVHVHFNEPGRTEWEGAATGSKALAAGGGTLFFDMPLNSSPCTVTAPAFDQKRAALERSSLTDFALWGGIIPGNRDSLDELAARGVIGFKAFLSDSGLPEFPRADDLTLYEGMRVAARHNLPVSVHAESEEITKALSRRARQAARTGVRDYLDSRPILAELEAIQRAALLAAEAGAKLHIVHVSSGRGVVAAAEARARGVDLTIETCPHYLFFSDEDMERLGAVTKCAPPLRPTADREHLWSQLRAGVIDIIASDHSPSSPDLKQRADFFEVWGGIAGVQSTLNVLIDGGLPPLDIARLTAHNPAERFRLPRKGRIQPGFDADLALIDLSARTTLHASDLHYRHKLSPYTGYTFAGAVKSTFLRGRLAGEAPGRFIRPER